MVALGCVENQFAEEFAGGGVDDADVEVLGEDYQGVLVSDCFLAYDPLPFKKSKRSAHLLKRCSEVEQSKSRGAVRFSRRVAALLRRAMALKRRRGTIGDHGYAVLRGKVHAELDRLLAGTYTDPDNARLAKLLRKHRGTIQRVISGHWHRWVDAGTEFGPQHLVIGSTRYDEDAYLILEIDRRAGTHRALNLESVEWDTHFSTPWPGR